MWLKTISKRTIRLRSGIRFEINATPHSFKSFQQITPSHRRHIPARRERHIKQVSGFLHSSDRKSAQPNAGFQNGMRGELYQQNSIFSQPGDFLSLPVERKLRLDREVPPFALPSKSCLMERSRSRPHTRSEYAFDTPGFTVFGLSIQARDPGKSRFTSSRTLCVSVS